MILLRFPTPKSTENRRKFNLGRFWALQAVSGTRRDALGTAPARPKAASKPILGRPGRAKSGQEPSESVPGPPRRHSKILPVSRPSAYGAPSGFARAFGSIFGRFRLVARKLRCAFRISFYSVLLCSSEVSSERVRATKQLQNWGVSASAIEPWSVRATQNRARAARATEREKVA